MKKVVYSMMAFAMAFAFAACGSDKNDPSPSPSPTPTPIPTPTASVTEADLDAAVAQYVDGVVLPTYKALAENNEALNNAVEQFRKALGVKRSIPVWSCSRQRSGPQYG